MATNREEVKAELADQIDCITAEIKKDNDMAENELRAQVAVAWARYTAWMAEKGVDVSRFTDTEKLAFQAGFAAGKSCGLDTAIEISDSLRSKA
jgi:hypothetical protein